MNAKFRKLMELVKQHESYWSSFALRLPTKNARAVMRRFYRETWDPWYSRIQQFALKGLSEEEQEDLATEAGQGLSGIRNIARSMNIPVPDLQAIAVSGWTDKLRNLLRSKEAKEMAPFIPYGSFALGTLDKINTLVHDANEGDPQALQTVKEIKARSDAGDVKASEAAATMLVVSKAQKLKNAKNKSLYARGVAVGHDPVMFVGATRRHAAGSAQPAPSGAGARVADHRGKKTVIYYGPPAKGSTTKTPYLPFSQNIVAPPTAGTPSKRSVVAPLPGQTPQVPGQQPYDPYADPYGAGQYGMPQYGYPPLGDPYGQYGSPGFPGVPGYGCPPWDPYCLGLPYGYGQYEEPIIDKGGYQQYDEATDSFYSSNQKQVYDEATGMFYPANQANPYGF